MTVRPFVAILPKQTQIGDEIVLKGKIKDDAQTFSINFTLECCPIPLNVAYHFKTNFVDNTVTHNYKTVGIWNDEVVEENTWIQGSGNKIIHSVVCQEFVLTFHFDDSEILVYSDDENRCFQYRFGYQFDIGDIKSVQVWDDVDYINEIIFRYKKE